MTKIAITVFTAITLAAAMMPIARGNSAGSASKPSSFAPQSNPNGHVYGTPIERPIVHTKSSRHKHPQRNTAASAKTGYAPKAPAHHGNAK